MTLRECYEKIGGDYEGSCKRLMNEKLLERFLQKFFDDPSMQLLVDAVKEGNIESSFRAVHTLKGVAGNLGLSRLYNSAVNLTEQLRPRQNQADSALLLALIDEYNATTGTLKEYFAAKEA